LMVQLNIQNETKEPNNLQKQFHQSSEQVNDTILNRNDNEKRGIEKLGEEDLSDHDWVDLDNEIIADNNTQSKNSHISPLNEHRSILFHSPLFWCDGENIYMMENKCESIHDPNQFTCSSTHFSDDLETGNFQTFQCRNRTQKIPSSCSLTTSLLQSPLYPSPPLSTTSLSPLTLTSELLPENETILGCLVGSYIRTSVVTPDVRSLLIQDAQKHPLMFYIMTLGTLSEKRKLGLGTDLISKCMDFVQKEDRCGVVYLHVITYNFAAIRFYETLGFKKMKEIEGESVCKK